MYVILYSIIGIITSILLFNRGKYLSFFAMKSGKKLQMQLIKSILKSPLNWFDITPSGRILARTNKD